MTSINRSCSTSILLAATLVATCPLTAQTGTASGKVITESGQPMGGINVLYRRSPKLVADSHFHLHLAPGEQSAAGVVVSGANGTFTIPNLPAGNYALCVNNPPALYVDPCYWGLSANSFTVTAGSNTATKPFTIIAGVRVHFLITDPQSLLPSGAQLDPVAHVGVVALGHVYRPAVVNGRTGGVIDVVVTVPHNQPVTSSFFSSALKFSDATGALIQSSAITLPAGATDYNIPLTVTK